MMQMQKEAKNVSVRENTPRPTVEGWDAISCAGCPATQ